MLLQFVQGLRRTATLQITGGGTQHAPIADQTPTDVMAWKVIANANLQIEAFIDDVHHPVKQVEANFQFWITFGQQRHRRRDVIATETEAAANVQTPTRAVVGVAEFVVQLLKVIENAQRPALHAFTVLGQRDATAGAVQQASTEGGFKNLDAFADVGR
ncbi:hypothetical protein PS681_05907 [Pseudomonas fluorescens]|nr:hypothetical protein PS681_05907 [Pseudomonas fluorescens]